MSDLYILDKQENEKYRVKIVQDFNPLNPRKEWDNLGVMICWHSRYNLGDKIKTPFSDPEDFYNYVKDFPSIILPLYLLNHSGLTMSTGSFNDPWDSGQVGYIYVSKETIRKEWNVTRISKKLREKVIKCLEAEVETYSQYLKGDVWGFVIEDVKTGEYLDSCWGFYGSNPKENGMWDCWSEEIRKLVDSNYEINPKGYFLDKQLELPLAM